jgi:hypothetical protein
VSSLVVADENEPLIEIEVAEYPVSVLDLAE